jgi:hypothetical protein
MMPLPIAAMVIEMTMLAIENGEAVSIWSPFISVLRQALDRRRGTGSKG